MILTPSNFNEYYNYFDYARNCIIFFHSEGTKKSDELYKLIKIFIQKNKSINVIVIDFYNESFSDLIFNCRVVEPGPALRAYFDYQLFGEIINDATFEDFKKFADRLKYI